MGALVIAPASASFVPALGEKTESALRLSRMLTPSFFVLPALLIMELYLVPGQRMKELPPVHLKVFFPPAPDSASPSDAGR